MLDIPRTFFLTSFRSSCKNYFSEDFSCLSYYNYTLLPQFLQIAFLTLIFRNYHFLNEYVLYLFLFTYFFMYNLYLLLENKLHEADMSLWFIVHLPQMPRRLPGIR